jgi:hypothetical protein
VFGKFNQSIFDTPGGNRDIIGLYIYIYIYIYIHLLRENFPIYCCQFRYKVVFFGSFEVVMGRLGVSVRLYTIY